MRRLLFALSLLIYSIGLSQSTEYLIKIINRRHTDDTVKINALIKLSQLVEPTNLDSAYYLLDLAQHQAQKALKKIKHINYKNYIQQQLALIYYRQALIQIKKENLGLALNLLNKSLDYYLKKADSANIALVEQNIGDIYLQLNDLSSAQLHYEQSIAFANKKSKTYGKSLHKLADILALQKNWIKAEQFYTKSLQILQNTDSQQSALILYNLANVSSHKGDTTKAINYLIKSLAINFQLNDKKQIFSILITIGDLLLQQNLVDSAFNYFILAYDVANGLTPDHQAKAQYYIAKVYAKQKKLKRAEQIAQKAFMFAQFEKDTLLMIQVADLLKDINLNQGNCPLALKYLDIKSKLETRLLHLQHQNMFDLNNKITQIKHKAALDSLSQQLIKERQIRTVQQQKYKQTITLGLAFISILLLFIILSAIKHKRTIDHLEKQLENNPKIQELIEQLTSHQQQLEQHQEKIKSLLTQFETDYINANLLIKSVLPKTEIIKPFLKDFFYLYIPRQEISGDFYWWTAKDKILYVSVADTTGRGISGALMSTLGIHLLNQAVIRQNISDPSKILNFVRNGIIRHLHQTQFSTHSESINMSLIRIDSNTLSLAFAGAKQCIYIIPPKTLQISDELKKKIHHHKYNNTNLYELRPDLMPLGLFVKMHQFETLTINLTENTQIYLFTDGFSNQFGGEFDEKFGRKKFRQLIMQISQKPMNEQKQILIDTFNSWKGEQEQTDDVTIVGLKI